MPNASLISKGVEIITMSKFSESQDLMFIRERRNGGLLFFDSNEEIYIKFGLKKIVKSEFGTQKSFEDYGFPVPPIQFSYEYEDYFFYGESKIGGIPIGQLISRSEIDYEKGIEILSRILKDFLEAQKRTINNNPDLERAKHKLHLEEFKKEIIDLKVWDKDFLKRLYEKIYELLERQKFFVLSHGDFNSWNIFEKGFIDVEDAHNGINSYDFVSFITHQYWFPVEGGERKLSFSFSISDIKKRLDRYSKIFDVSVEEVFDFAFVLRGIWACFNMGHYPKEQKYRFQRFRKYADRLLKGENLLSYFLEEIDEINTIFFKKFGKLVPSSF